MILSILEARMGRTIRWMGFCYSFFEIRASDDFFQVHRNFPNTKSTPHMIGLKLQDCVRWHLKNTGSQKLQTFAFTI